MTGDCKITGCGHPPVIVMVAGCLNLHLDELRYCQLHTWKIDDFQEFIENKSWWCRRCHELMEDSMTLSLT
jgi:hypothetical protein